MGNRAVITVGDEHGWYNPLGLGIYLHWNGGRDSVNAFLTYCKLHGFRSPSDDPHYGFARLAQVIANFFGGDGLSVGVGIVCQLDTDNYDNGTYTIKGWDIVGRKFFEGVEQDKYDLNGMLLDIDAAQPASMQIREYLEAEPVEVSDFQIGDTVVFLDYRGQVQKAKIAGFGQDKMTLSLIDVGGVPYMDFYGDSTNHDKNINNYLISDSKTKYRKVKKESK